MNFMVFPATNQLISWFFPWPIDEFYDIFPWTICEFPDFPPRLTSETWAFLWDWWRNFMIFFPMSDWRISWLFLVNNWWIFQFFFHMINWQILQYFPANEWRNLRFISMLCDQWMYFAIFSSMTIKEMNQKGTS